MYVKLTDGAAQAYSLGEFYLDNRGMDFPEPMTAEFLSKHDVYRCEPTSIPTIDYKQNLAAGVPKHDGKSWVQTWVITSATDEEISERETDMRRGNKDRASTLLAETDYTDLPNTASRIANLEDMLSYRNALRSIAIDPPLFVKEWPVKPDTVWSDAP
jgi:hypothetical protein